MTVYLCGQVLPCPVAGSIGDLHCENIRERTLAWIWESPSFNRYRGVDWMPDPCRSCELRFADFGGCRCQAYALTGDATRTDPVCQWLPDHGLVVEAIAQAERATSVRVEGAGIDPRLVYRGRRESGRIRGRRLLWEEPTS